MSEDRKSPNIKFKTLQASTQEDVDLFRAALEWSVIEPLIIESRDDIQSQPQWQSILKPFNHQVSNLMTFCRRLPVALLADDVGLGKTISAGLILSELMTRGRVSKVLIVCPKLIMPQWKEELQDKFNINSSIAIGKELIDKSDEMKIGAIITTYNSARLYLDEISDKGFGMLILDEAHKLRNLYGVEKSPQVAQKFRNVLANRIFKYVLMLTATPIQNRLWDLYSLMDLLAVARGHQNPFGSEGMFKRNYIADDRESARKLNLGKKDEFRSIVYSQVSRMRRADAKLHFPNRKIFQHEVTPEDFENEIWKILVASIKKLLPLVQISLLKAFVSSPQALAVQLKNMVEKGTAPASLAEKISVIANNGKPTAKLLGLGRLAEQLKNENPNNWRMVVFTTRLETQTSIEAFLSERGIKCGIINGGTGGRNQDTIGRFKQKNPEIHVIVSTEAGSEGVNLQAANVIVNYDLPWNPMIVEQRIGRVQRLASEHEYVCVYNVILRGTFEQIIVGRLMEKLQMASQAIGDIDSLLEAAGINDNEDESGSFEDKIRELVLASIAGKDVDSAIRKQEQSILEAKEKLEQQKKNLDDILGSGEEYQQKMPKAPKLPAQSRTMELVEFVRKASVATGGGLIQSGTQYELTNEGKVKVISFERGQRRSEDVIFFGPGEPSFEKLADKITHTGKYLVTDLDRDIPNTIETLARDWVHNFEGKFKDVQVKTTTPIFQGSVLVRVRVTVAHDSYERLIDVQCVPDEQKESSGSDSSPLPKFIYNLKTLGISSDQVLSFVRQEKGVSEFCRFYKERLDFELQYATTNERLYKKLVDEFTPSFDIEVVSLNGVFYRRIDAAVNFWIGSEFLYGSRLVIMPSKNKLIESEVMGECMISHRQVPVGCLEKCSISNNLTLKEHLKISEVSGRKALSDKTVRCSLSGKQVLIDEVTTSSVSGQLVETSLLHKSEISGKLAEPKYFFKCAFTGVHSLADELVISQISGKKFRSDQKIISSVSGKIGHSSEFILCAHSNRPLLVDEANKCEVTGKVVCPDLIEQCQITGKKALTTELAKCMASGKVVL